jgi:hypothetical protein
MVKYDLVHQSSGPQSGSSTELMLQAYNPATGRNQSYTERVSTATFEDRMAGVKRKLSSMGMALVRHDLFATA